MSSMNGDDLTEKYINVHIFTTFVHKMTTILKPTIREILNIFQKNKNQPVHLREIARQTGLYGQSIVRYLNQLEKEGMLTSKKEGNLKRYALQNNDLVYSWLTLLDIERYNKLPKIRKDAIKYYLKKLPEPPIFAVLFGSTAKGTFKQESDIDLLIITNRKINTKEAENEADALCAVKISTFQMLYQKFIKELKLKEDHVVQSAIFSGYPLINHISYYEVLNNEGI